MLQIVKIQLQQITESSGPGKETAVEPTAAVSVEMQ